MGGKGDGFDRVVHHRIDGTPGLFLRGNIGRVAQGTGNIDMGQCFTGLCGVGQILKNARAQVAGAVIQDVDAVVSRAIGGPVRRGIDDPLTVAVKELDLVGHTRQGTVHTRGRNADIAVLILAAIVILQEILAGYLIIDLDTDLLEDAQGSVMDGHGIVVSKDG